MNAPRDWFALAVWIAITLGAGALGGVASANANEFYAELTKPAWAPPSWLFGPVWSALYVIIGMAAWLVWRERNSTDSEQARLARRATGLFVIHLALNALWTWLFFAWRLGGWAFAEIVLLWLIVVLLVVWFARVRSLAAALLLPYLAWLTFAAALNWSVWRANPRLL